MKVLNLIWKYTTGGIGKCFITYSKCGIVDENVKVLSACIDPQSFNYDRKPLERINAIIIKLRNRWDLSWINKVYELIKKEEPDVIFTHGLYGPIIVSIVKLFHPSIRTIPMVGSYHGLYNPPTKATVPIASFFNNLQVWIYKHFTSKVVIVSRFSGQYLLNKGLKEDKISVVYNGLPDKGNDFECNVNLPKNVINIGLTARIDAIKGIDYLLEALADIIKERKNIHLYIIGDGPLEQEMKTLASNLKVDKYVTFTGYQNNISSWLHELDIFVLPSLQENHSIALLEAMREGKAIVCTDVGGNTESVTNEIEALIVPSKDKDALSRSLSLLIESEELRLKLGTAARKRFNLQFTENRTLQDLIEVFKSINCYENKN